MCLITNQTKMICLALYMQNYRWSKNEAMHCIILIRISKRSVLKRICVQGYLHLIMTWNRWAGFSIFSFRVFPFGRHLGPWGPRNLGLHKTAHTLLLTENARFSSNLAKRHFKLMFWRLTFNPKKKNFKKKCKSYRYYPFKNDIQLFALYQVLIN